jgi:hypothetical protein
MCSGAKSEMDEKTRRALPDPALPVKAAAP